MKILYVTTGLNMGGAEVALYNLLQRINRNNFEPVVVSLMGRGGIGDRIEALNIPVYALDLRRGRFNLGALWQLVRLIHELKPDVIQGWMYHGNFAAYLANLLSWRQIPVLWSIHHSIASLESEKGMTQVLIKMGAWLSFAVHKVIFVSQASCTQHQALGYSPDKCCIIPNGFDCNLFKPNSTSRIQLKAELGLSENSILIGQIARYHPMKDHANFLHAAALLSTICPEAHFVLAGTQVDASNSELRELIQQLNLSEKVSLLGERRDTPYLFSGLDIVTSASAYGEAFPMILGEAMACEVTCVATDVGDSRLILGETGVTVPPRNAQALFEGWQMLLQTKERKLLGQKARLRILENFSIEAIISAFESIYSHAASQQAIMGISSKVY